MISEPIRAFIAIELPPEIKATLTGLQNKLRPAGGNAARWVESGGIHLTLKFLGNVPRGQIDGVKQAMAAARGTPTFGLHLGECGCFPDTRRPRVIWVGLNGDLKLLDELVKKLEIALARLGFKPEGRPFTPHLTLARVKDTATPEERQTLGAAVLSLPIGNTGTIKASEICLMQSKLLPQGALYTHLAAIELGDAGEKT
jgi:2'-5' RNA ligase